MNRLLLSGLQLFNEAVQGKKIVYLYRVRSEQAKNDATALAFTTENGRTKSKDADTKKDVSEDAKVAAKPAAQKKEEPEQLSLFNLGA